LLPAIGIQGRSIDYFWVLILDEFPIDTSGSDPESSHAASIGYAIQPGGKAIPSPQAAQVAISLKKDFLCDVLGVLKVAKLSIHIGIPELCCHLPFALQNP
jgi:hypothetical protein